MYGTQTVRRCNTGFYLFENDVKMYGTQTGVVNLLVASCLRMM